MSAISAITLDGLPCFGHLAAVAISVRGVILTVVLVTITALSCATAQDSAPHGGEGATAGLNTEPASGPRGVSEGGANSAGGNTAPSNAGLANAGGGGAPASPSGNGGAAGNTLTAQGGNAGVVNAALGGAAGSGNGSVGGASGSQAVSNAGSGGVSTSAGGTANTGGASGSGGPCAGSCAMATQLASPGNTGSLGTSEKCFEIAFDLKGGTCGNFLGTRSFSIDSTAIVCNGGNWPALPPKIAGGYCIRVGAGDYADAYFQTW